MRIFDLDKLNEIFIAISRNKARTFFTCFGVFYGIMMLVFMISAGNGFKSVINYQMQGFSTNSIFVWTRSTTIPYKGLQINRTPHLELSDVKALKEKVNCVDLVSPVVPFPSNTDGDNVAYGDNSGSFQVNGVYPVEFDVSPVHIIKGRKISPLDIRDLRKVAVIGEKVWNDIFDKDENVVGKTVKISNIAFRVIGVMKAKSKNNERSDESVFLPLNVSQSFSGFGDLVGYMTVTSKKGYSADQMQEEVISLLKERHDVHPDDKGGIGSFNLAQLFEKISSVSRGLTLLTWAVGLGMLLSGVIGIGNIMTIVVKERTREIGVQRALGATPYNIISQIVTESILLTTLAGFTGMFIGSLLAKVGELIFQKQEPIMSQYVFINIDYNSSLIALGLLIFSGLFAGLFPAYKALKIKAIDALRYE